MRKWIYAFLIGLMLMQVSACGKEEKENQPVPAVEEENNTAEEQPSQTENKTDTEEPSYYGTWEVKDAQRAAVYALSEDEINAFLGSSLFYSADTFRLNEEEREISGYAFENVAYTEDMIVEEYSLNLGEWWNEKPQVMYYAISSEDNYFGRQFFVADEETLWIYHEGVMFLARRAEN